MCIRMKLSLQINHTESNNAQLKLHLSNHLKTILYCPNCVRVTLVKGIHVMLCISKTS